VRYASFRQHVEAAPPSTSVLLRSYGRSMKRGVRNPAPADLHKQKVMKGDRHFDRGRTTWEGKARSEWKGVGQGGPPRFATLRGRKCRIRVKHQKTSQERSSRKQKKRRKLEWRHRESHPEPHPVHLMLHGRGLSHPEPHQC